MGTLPIYRKGTHHAILEQTFVVESNALSVALPRPLRDLPQLDREIAHGYLQLKFQTFSSLGSFPDSSQALHISLTPSLVWDKTFTYGILFGR